MCIKQVKFIGVIYCNSIYKKKNFKGMIHDEHYSKTI